MQIMNEVEILANEYYLPKNKITNEVLAKRFHITEDWIVQRTGIQNRYWAKEEEISTLAVKAVQNLLTKYSVDTNKIGCIVVATTSTNTLMPGISFAIQKAMKLEKCICMDLLAGCSGYINALDLARKYLLTEEIEYALVVGAEKLTSYLEEQDCNTVILLGDGAGCTLLGKTQKQKEYTCLLESQGKDNEILTCRAQEKIYMDGKKVYKYAITKTVENIKQLLKKANIAVENIQHFVVHQSNIRILKKIAEVMEIDFGKVYVDLEDTGNTFCASIPIALAKMEEKGLLKKGEILLLLGYGGGLNLGSILIEY